MRRLVLITWLATSSCAALLQLVGQTVQTPTLQFRGATVTDVSLGGLTLDTVWQLTNPNMVALSLASVDYMLVVDEHQVVAGRPPQGLQVPANGTAELHFPATVRFLELGQLATTFFSKDTAAWRVEGSVGVDTPIGLVSVPLSQSGVVDIPKLPEVAFQAPRVASVTMVSATVVFPLTVTNRNAFALPVEAVSGSVALNGNTVGTLSTGNLGALGPHATATVNVPLTVEYFNAAAAFVDVARGGRATVRFEAKVRSGGADVPLVLEQSVDLVK